MSLKIVAGVFLLSLIILIILFFLWKRGAGPLNIHKEVDKGTVTISIEAKRAIKKLTITEKRNKDELKFVRKDINSGEHVEFNYPAFVGSGKISTIVTADCEDGTHEFEVL